MGCLHLCPLAPPDDVQKLLIKRNAKAAAVSHCILKERQVLKPTLTLKNSRKYTGTVLTWSA